MNLSLSQLMQFACNPTNTSSFFAIDVGAHHGEYSNFLISTGFFSKVVSFEPNPESYLKLEKKVSPTDGCKYERVNSALSSVSGTLDLYCDDDTATASLLKYGQSYLNRGTLNKCSVTVFTLDEYLKRNPTDDKLQLLKIDTQGNDLAVIKGGVRTISTHRPIIQTELIYIPLYEGQCSPTELSNTLSQLDYEMYSLFNLHATPEGRLAFCDAIFIPKELNIPITHKYSCTDDQASFLHQLDTLTKICAERLSVINLLDSEVQRLNKIKKNNNRLDSILKRFKLWVQ